MGRACMAIIIASPRSEDASWYLFVAMAVLPRSGRQVGLGSTAPNTGVRKTEQDKGLNRTAFV